MYIYDKYGYDKDGNECEYTNIEDMCCSCHRKLLYDNKPKRVYYKGKYYCYNCFKYFDSLTINREQKFN